MEQKEKRAFIPISEFRRKVLGDEADLMQFDESTAVTLEISALQYFPWFITEAKRAIEKGEVMPGRFIRVRNMKEQERDKGDIMAVAAATQIVGASLVETLDTKGTDGSNIHLGGPETLTGYFTGVGQPNDHPVQWGRRISILRHKLRRSGGIKRQSRLGIGRAHSLQAGRGHQIQDLCVHGHRQLILSIHSIRLSEDAGARGWFNLFVRDKHI